MQHLRFSVLFLTVFMCGLWTRASSQTPAFDLKKYLFGPQHTLSIWVVSVDTSTGDVEINGGDSRCPTDPFSWDWGDGSSGEEFFPQSHTYTDTMRNYNVRVIANYTGGEHDTTEVLVRFVAPVLTPIPLSPVITVHVPRDPIVLGTHLYDPPAHLVGFDDGFFITTPRSTIEYLLSVAATVEADFVNENMYLFNNKFEEYLLRDSTFGGAYSLWFTNPVAFGAGDGYLQGTIDYSSFFHEMGHNFTLNTPADFYYGGRIDGNANAIFSESMAQIFQHAAGYELINHYGSYGLSEDIILEMKQRVIQTILLVRSSYEEYLSTGKPYASWNDPATPDVDETFLTFMTIAYEFCAHAENSGLGYRQPVKRMMTLLQGFNQDWAQRYDHWNNTAEADTFRATLLVAALSYAFATDVRAEFRSLNFPISDQVYTDLYNSPLPIQLAGFTGHLVPPQSVRLDWRTISEVNNYGFEVQCKGETQASFQTVPNSFVAGHGTTLEPHDYSFVDSAVSTGSWSYRLKQIDLDGTVHFTDPIRIEIHTGVADYPLPVEFRLEQNSPNPFNPTTTIRFSIPPGIATSHVTSLRVYDMLGREVATLVNEVKQPGAYTVQFDAGALASGVYYYQLRAGSFIDTRKFVLLR